MLYTAIFFSQYRQVKWRTYWEILNHGDHILFWFAQLALVEHEISQLSYSNLILTGEINYIIYKMELTKLENLLKEVTLKLFIC